jgi:hypothetical protein
MSVVEVSTDSAGLDIGICSMLTCRDGCET